jgi:hypothetical protein
MSWAFAIVMVIICVAVRMIMFVVVAMLVFMIVSMLMAMVMCVIVGMSLAYSSFAFTASAYCTHGYLLFYLLVFIDW